MMKVRLVSPHHMVPPLNLAMNRFQRYKKSLNRKTKKKNIEHSEINWI